VRGHVQVTFYNQVRADQLGDVLLQGLWIRLWLFWSSIK